MYSFHIYISINCHCNLVRDDLFYVNTAKQGVEAQLDLLLCTKSKCLSIILFFNIKFAECTRKVYHLGYRIFLGVVGRGSVRKLLLTSKYCLDLIQKNPHKTILKLMWKNKMATVLKVIEIYC